ncbi:hypothetical protein ABPG73_020712 [Tetrahymena malaccensis]
MNYNQFEQLQNDKYFFELNSQQRIECKNLKFDVQDIFGNELIQKDEIKFQIEDERTESNNFKVSFEKHQGIFLVQFTKPSNINNASISFSSKNLEQSNKLCPIEIIQINIIKQLYLLIGVGEGYLNVIKYIEKKQKTFDDIDQIYQIIIKYLQILFQMSCDTFLQYQINQQPQDFDIDNDDDLDDLNVEEDIRKYDDDKEKLVIYIQNISQLVTGFGKFKGMQIYDKFDQQNKDYAMVGVFGNLNKGKTFMINKLSRSAENLSREGELQRTHGITITQQTIKNKTFFFADIEGNQQAYNMNLKQINKIFSNEIQKEDIPYLYSKLQENCINQFMIEHCNVLLFITNSLSDDEQNAIEELKNYLKQKDKQIDLRVDYVQKGLKVLTLNKKEGEINFLVNQHAIAESKFGFISSNLTYTIKESQLQNNSKILVAVIELPGFKKEELVNSLNIKLKSSSITIQSKQYEQSRMNQSQNQHEKFSQNTYKLNHQLYPQFQIKKQISKQSLSEQYLTNTIIQDINELIVDDKDEDEETQTDQYQASIEQESLETIKQKKLSSFLIQIPIKSEIDEHNNKRNIDFEATEQQFQNVDKIISLINGIIIFKFEIKYESINQ